VRLEELAEGMIMAGDLTTGNGMKLLAKDSKVTQTQIQRIVSLNHFDPIIHEIYIYDSNS
jgi:hypothetical protein